MKSFKKNRVTLCILKMNKKFLDMVATKQKIYYSFDSIYKTSANTNELKILYLAKCLNTLEFNYFSPHKLNLKINTPIIVLHNLNSSLGFCNGTRLIITYLENHVIKAIVITKIPLQEIKFTFLE